MAEPKKTKNGKYRMRVFVCKDDDGKEIFKSFTADTAPACKRQYRAWLEAGGKQLMIEEIRTAKSPTIQQCIDTYIEQCKNSQRKTYSPATIRGYVMAAKRGFDLINDVKVERLTIDDIQDLIDYRAQTVVAKTIRNAMYILKPAIRQYRNDLDFAQLVYPDQDREDYVIPTDQEMYELLSAYQDNDDMYIATVLAGFLGMRRSEICALTWGDIDQQAMIIHVRHALVIGVDREYHDKDTKTVSGRRDLDITPDILDVLKRRAVIDGKLYDPESRIVRITPKALTAKHIKTTRRLGHNYTFHGLRHYHCSTMIALGVPFTYIVRSMGHADETMAKRVYGQMVRDKERAVADMVNSHASTVLKGDCYNWQDSTTNSAGPT